MIAVWLAASAALVALCFWRPAFAPFTGLLLGGSLSHAWEFARRGCVRDYICLRFLARVNFADVAITCGGIGMLLQLACWSCVEVCDESRSQQFRPSHWLSALF